MVYSFNWSAQPKGDTKASEVATTKYIKVKYGMAPAEFAKKIIAEQVPQEKLADKGS